MAEPVLFLKLSANHECVEQAASRAPKAIEDFLDQLDGSQQIEVLSRLLNGDALIAQHGEEQGRELAAYRLSLLMKTVGKAASELSDVFVFDVVVPGEDTTTDVELSKLTVIN